MAFWFSGLFFLLICYDHILHFLSDVVFLIPSILLHFFSPGIFLPKPPICPRSPLAYHRDAVGHLCCTPTFSTPYLLLSRLAGLYTL